VCSSEYSDCSNNSQDDVTLQERRCKACLRRGLSPWPVLHQPPKSQTVSIFDWDDTLLCTSVLTNAGAGYDTGHVPLPSTWLLPYIARAASNLLESACRLGPTFIITNASEGWVQTSAQRWMPALLPALGKVDEIISARSRYQWQDPDVSQWKLHAFLELQRGLDQRPVTNIIAVGDSDYEMDAARAMAGQFPRAVVKLVKFKSSPMALDLLKELELLREKLDEIVEAGSALHLRLGHKPFYKPPDVDGGMVTQPAAARINRVERGLFCCC